MDMREEREEIDEIEERDEREEERDEREGEDEREEREGGQDELKVIFQQAIQTAQTTGKFCSNQSSSVTDLPCSSSPEETSISGWLAHTHTHTHIHSLHITHRQLNIHQLYRKREELLYQMLRFTNPHTHTLSLSLSLSLSIYLSTTKTSLSGMHHTKREGNTQYIEPVKVYYKYTVQ